MSIMGRTARFVLLSTLFTSAIFFMSMLSNISYAADNGVSLWTANGVEVCASSGLDSVGGFRLVNDGSNGVILSWAHSFTIGNTVGIYAQRLSSSGSILWAPANGVGISTAQMQLNVDALSDNSGGEILSWIDWIAGSGGPVWAQRINSSGVTQWIPSGGVTVCAANTFNIPRIAPCGTNEAIITWYSAVSSGDVFAQHLNGIGALQWSPFSTGVTICAANNAQMMPQAVSDGSNGAIIIFLDFRSGTQEVYAQRVDSTGAVKWGGGVTICAVASLQNFGDPGIISDGTGGAIVTWMDRRNDLGDIYVQRLNGSGVPQWTPSSGVPVCVVSGTQNGPSMINDGSNGAIIIWSDQRGSDTDIYAQRVNSGGVPQWTMNGVPICTAAGNQQYPQLASDGAGGAVIVWQDARTDSGDIYAQRVDRNGAVKWTSDGTLVCNASGTQSTPRIINAGTLSAIIGWRDERDYVGEPELFAQKIMQMMDNVYVSSTGSDISGDGSASNPFKTIAFALNYVNPGGTVNLLAGTYQEHDIIWPNVNNITLSGAGMGVSTIDAHSLGRIISMESAVNVTIEGITLKNGYASDVAPNGGGAIYFPGAGNIYLIDCSFMNNSAEAGDPARSGGAISFQSVGNIYLDGCSFMNNSAGNSLTGQAGKGGAICCQGASSFYLNDCSFTNNSAGSAESGGSGAYGGDGGAINALAVSNPLTVVGCLFMNNSAGVSSFSGGRGGGICTGNATITNCVFIANSAPRDGGGAFITVNGNFINSSFLGNSSANGGAIWNNNFLNVVGCLFTSNEAGPSGDGGGIYSYITANVTNCVFAGNASSGGKGGGACFGSGSVINSSFLGNLGKNGGAVYSGSNVMENDILWKDYVSSGGSGSEIYSNGTLVITYSDLTSGEASISGTHTYGTGNISADPLFVNQNGNDLHLTSLSPCINKGTTLEAPANDLDGVSRPQGGYFDMGAYEYVGTLRVTNSRTAIGYFTIKDALNDVNNLQAGDVLSCQGGVYYENNIQWPNISGVILQGAGTGSSTIDAQSIGRVISVESAVTMTIEGITLMNGLAPDIANYKGGGSIYSQAASNIYLYNCSLINNVASNSNAFEAAAGDGGAIYSPAATNLYLVGCSFMNNSAASNSGTESPAGNGGAISLRGTICASGCAFVNNSAGGTSNTQSTAGNGGAIYSPGSSGLSFTGCSFMNNSAGSTTNTQARAGNGGAIYFQGASNIYLNGCSFVNNSAGSTEGWQADAGSGGAVNGGNLTVVGCLFTGNNGGLATGGQTNGGNGGAINANTTTLTNCVFAGNSSKTGSVSNSSGGAVYTSNGSVVNSSFLGNTSNNGGAIYFGSGANVVINSIFWNDSVFPGGIGQEISDHGTLTVTYSDLTSGEASISGTHTYGTGNISAEPMFVSTSAPYNLALSTSESPCVNTGTSGSAPSTDILGVARPQPPGGMFDMGAYEYMGPLRVTNSRTAAGYFSIRDALNDVNLQAGDALNCQGGVYYENNINWPAITNITLRSDPSATSPVTVDAQSSGRVINVGTAVNLTIEGITIRNGDLSNNGGGIYLQMGSTLWLNTVIVSCCSAENSSDGGAVYSNGATVYVKDSTFSGNSAYDGGVANGGSWVVSNSAFNRNSATNGGVACGSPWVVTNSTFSGNNSPNGGVAYNGMWTVTNSTFNGNISNHGGVAYFGKWTIINSIFAGGSSDMFDSMTAGGSMKYSDVYLGNWSANLPTTECISADPIFISTDETDQHFLQLSSGSPCIDTGTSEGAPASDKNYVSRPQPPGGRFDMGAYESVNSSSGGPTIESVMINGMPFSSGGVISPSVSIRVHLVDINNVTNIEVTPDIPSTPVVLTLTSGTPNDGYWEGSFTLGTSSQTKRTLTFLAADSVGNITSSVMNAQILSGAVQVIGMVLNYPNPFKPLSTDPNLNTTNIQYTLSVDAPVTIITYDITGHEVMRKTFGQGENGGRAGVNSVIWNGSNLFGEVSGNGMYIYKIISKNKVIGTGKLVILD